jgi:hypothetical protein
MITAIKTSFSLRVIENRMPRTIQGSKTEEVMEGWRKLHNGKPHNLYSSQNVKVIKSRLRWVGHTEGK